MNSPELTPEDEEIIEAAARWFHVRDSGAGMDAPAFEAWLSADPRHRQRFDDLVARDARLQGLKEAPELLAMRSEALNFARRSAVLANSGERHVTRRNLMAACAAGAVVLAGAIWGGTKFGTKTFKTAIGEQRTLKLADESTVVLDANSEVRVHYKTKERRLYLVSGRAHFEVAKDAQRPFVVHAHDKTVTALGTAFTIDLQGEQVAVTLIEGRISIKKDAGHGAQQPISDAIQPNQQLVLADTGRVQLIRDVDPVRSQGWREGAIYFEDNTLEEAVERMNNYSRTQIEIESGRLRALRISGQFSAGNTGSFLDAISSYYPVTVEKAGETVVLRDKT